MDFKKHTRFTIADEKTKSTNVRVGVSARY